MFPHVASISSTVVSNVMRISLKFHIMLIAEMSDFI
jgi:hypothetical protein